MLSTYDYVKRDGMVSVAIRQKRWHLSHTVEQCSFQRRQQIDYRRESEQVPRYGTVQYTVYILYTANCLILEGFVASQQERTYTRPILQNSMLNKSIH